MIAEVEGRGHRPIAPPQAQAYVSSSSGPSRIDDVIFLVGMFGIIFARWMLDDVSLGVGQDHLAFVTIYRDERAVGSRIGFTHTRTLSRWTLRAMLSVRGGGTGTV